MGYFTENYHPKKRRYVLVTEINWDHISLLQYEAFPAQVAKRLSDRYEFFYSPKYGSWLKMSEMEIN